MDITTLTNNLANFLAPLVPYLVAGGTAAAEAIGEDAWEKAKAIWARLRGRLPAEATVVKALAEDPQDPDALAGLRLELKRILQTDAELAQALADLLAEARAQAAQYVAVHGNDNAVAQGAGAVAASGGGVAIGGNVNGSVITTGQGGRRSR